MRNCTFVAAAFTVIVLLAAPGFAQLRYPVETLPGPSMRVPTGVGHGWRMAPPQAAAGQVLVNARPGVTPQQMADAAAAMGGRILDHYPTSTSYLITLDAGESVTAGAARWSTRPEVSVAGPNGLCYPTVVPNDPLYSQQWQWPVTNAPAAWDSTQGSSSVTVAVIDTGVWRSNPDLTTRVWVNQAELNGKAGVDDDGNGFVDDIYGWDFADKDNDPNPVLTSEGDAHGTHCAGLVGAAGNNGEGVVGYDWNCRIMGLRAGTATGLFLADLFDAMAYAVGNGAKVISLSVGGGYTDLWNDPIQAAVNAGVVVCAAAGNSSMTFTDSTATQFSPVCNDGPGATDNWVLGVGATGPDDVIAYYTNLDASSGHHFVDVMAPGGDDRKQMILSTFPYDPSKGFNTNYDYMEGTSMACPVTAGLVGLVRAKFPLLTPAAVIAKVRSACDNIDSQNPDTVGEMGSGRINGGNSVKDATPLVPKSISAFDTADDEGGSITVVWSKSGDDGKGANNVVSYTIERAEALAGPFADITTLGKGKTIYVNSPVPDGKPFYYKVRVANSAGLTSETKVAGPAIAADDLPPPVVTTLAVTDTQADEGGSISLDWHGYGAPSDFASYHVYRSGKSFSAVTEDGVKLLAAITDVTQQAYVDATTTDGVTYWYAVTALDDVGNEHKTVTALSAVSSPNFTFTFPPGSSMIAIGAQTTSKDMGTIFGVDPGALLISRWDPTTEAYHRYWETPTDTFLQQELGRAFWLTTADAIMLNISGQPAPAGDFSVGFVTGWNMIGNPFTADCDITTATVTQLGEELSLGDASRRGWARDYMWRYDAFLRSYKLVSPTIPFGEKAIRRGQGVFFNAFTTASLKLPRPSSAAEPTTTALAKQATVPVDWKISLVAECAGGSDVDNFVGVSSAAGKLNALVGPPAGAIDLYFSGPAGVHSAASFDGPGEEPAVRTLTVVAAQPGPVTLSWPDLTSMPRGLRPVLVDTVTGKRVYMRTCAAYSYDAGGAGRTFRMELGAATGSLIVNGLQARAAAVGAQVTFTLNRDANVSVEVRNLAGRVIRTLTAGRPAAGGELTTLAWDGRNSAGTKAPAGRYLVLITATTEDGQSAKSVGALNLR